MTTTAYQKSYEGALRMIEAYQCWGMALYLGWNGCQALDIYREPIVKVPMDTLLQKVVMFHYPAHTGWPATVKFP